MKQHTSPCKECPWRRASMPGWLGEQYSPEEFRAIAHSDSRFPCHRTIGKKEELQCAGMAIYRANVIKRPRDPAILILPVDREKVFATPDEFVTHHRSTGIVSSELDGYGSGLIEQEGTGR